MLNKFYGFFLLFLMAPSAWSALPVLNEVSSSLCPLTIVRAAVEAKGIEWATREEHLDRLLHEHVPADAFPLSTFDAFKVATDSPLIGDVVDSSEWPQSLHTTSFGVVGVIRDPEAQDDFLAFLTLIPETPNRWWHFSNLRRLFQKKADEDPIQPILEAMENPTFKGGTSAQILFENDKSQIRLQLIYYQAYDLATNQPLKDRHLMIGIQVKQRPGGFRFSDWTHLRKQAHHWHGALRVEGVNEFVLPVGFEEQERDFRHFLILFNHGVGQAPYPTLLHDETRPAPLVTSRFP